VKRVAGACLAGALALACATLPPADLPAPPAEPIDACQGAGGTGEVTVAYLRAGGLAILHEGEALLTAPFYSNPGFARVGLGLGIAPDRERIPERPALLDGARIAGVLIGHAHYDHAMDVPALLEEWGLAGAPVYGSRTAANLLRAVGVEATPVEPWAGDRAAPGRWLAPRPGSRFRVMPLRSEHAPHAWPGIKLFGGHVEEPPASRPRSAYGWKEGQTYAFLIDVLADDGETPLLRIHYQDAASNPELGWPPRELLAERRVDLALFCAASFSLVREHPQAILRELEPRHAMAAHWEDFSRDPGRPLRVVPLTDLPDLIERLRDTLPAGRFSVPTPGAQARFRVCEPG
jgi:hypothetical protein